MQTEIPQKPTSTLDEIRAALRWEMFAPNFHVDPMFWGEFGRLCLAEPGRVSPSDIHKFAKENKVRVPARWKYHLMDILFKRLQIDGGEYLATATQSELDTIEKNPKGDSTAARKFIYESPLGYKKIKRIFVLEDESFLSKLPDLKNLQAQLKLGVDLKIYLRPANEDVPNFGIYGSMAFGYLDGSQGASTLNEENVVSFDKAGVDLKRKNFFRYHELSKPFPTF